MAKTTITVGSNSDGDVILDIAENGLSTTTLTMGTGMAKWLARELLKQLPEDPTPRSEER